MDISKYDKITVNQEIKNQVIFVGRLIPHKHVDHLIKSISILKENIPDIKLVIVGKVEEKGKEKLRGRLKKLGLAKTSIIQITEILERENRGMKRQR